MTAIAAIKPDTENKEFQKALELIRDTNISFFLTGKAGTGKSTFLRHVIQNVDKNFIVVAPTGIAAVNVGGSTIHSMFLLPPRYLLPNDDHIQRFAKESQTGQLLRTVETIIIDEISMVRADLIDAIDESMRLNCGNSLLPFGGKQVIFVGDVFQLEPVMNMTEEEADMMKEVYDDKPLFFFNANVFEKFGLQTIELRKAYRQQEQHFLSILDNIRINEPTVNDIRELNKRMVNPAEADKKEFIITLCTTNKSAEAVNQMQLQKLTTKEFIYAAEIEKEFEKSKYPTDDNLRLRNNARVMFIKNDPEGRWVNGTIAQVEELSETEIKVRLKNGKVHAVPKVKWENTRYKYNRNTRKIEQEVIGSFTQFPLKLAWAITIHKSQGMTFEEAIIDFGTGAFAGGQSYVALSRCVTLDGVYLKNMIRRKDIFVHPAVKKIASSFNDFTKIESLTSEENELEFFSRNGLTEYIGQYHLDKCMDFLRARNFKKAYDNIVKGYELISNDDFITEQFPKDQFIKLFENSNDVNCNVEELEMLRAFVYFFLEFYDLSHESAQKCLKYNRNKSELAHYFSGRANMKMNRIKQAKDDFEAASSRKVHPRNLYQYSLALKEGGLKHVEYLIRAYLLNPSSMDVYKDLAFYIRNKNMGLVGENNELNKLFLAPDVTVGFLQKLNKQETYNLENGAKISSKDIFEYFKDIVEKNIEIIVKA